MFSAGVGVGSRSRFFKIAGVGVGFSKMLESESGVGVGFLKLLESESESVFQNCWSRSRNPKKSSDSTTLMSRSGIGQSDTKWLKRAGEMMDPFPMGPPPALGGKASNAAGIGTTPSCRGGTPQAI